MGQCSALVGARRPGAREETLQVGGEGLERVARVVPGGIQGWEEGNLEDSDKKRA